MSDINDLDILINRQAHNYKTYTQSFYVQTLKIETLCGNFKHYMRKYFTPSVNCGKKFLIDHLPVVRLIQTYKMSFILRDLIGGVTIGAMQIAPTMANSVMANLPPINGLYVAFFSVLMYVIFGTSRHLSLGTHGAISIMVGSVIQKYEGILYPIEELDDLLKQDVQYKALMFNETSFRNSSDEFISNDPTQAKIMIAMCLAFLVGIIQLILAIFNGGFITKFLSSVVIDAFTIGSSVVIIVSQINILLGYSIKDLDIPFELIDALIGIFQRIKQTNLVTVTISVITIVILFVVKRFINERFKKYLKIPIPIEFIVIILATLFSYIWDFKKKWNVSVVGPVPLGVPSPKLPSLGLFTYIIGDAFTIAFVSFALNISMVKYFSKKYNYPIDPNQELLSYGMGNVLTSFFQGFPAGGGLTRSLIMESTGAKTQVFSIISSIIVLVVIVGLGFLFQTLPNCCLAAIIVTSLLHKLFEIKKIANIYKKSKIEAFVWIATFGGTIILDVDYGLYFGIGASILMVFVQNQKAHSALLGNIPDTELYEDINMCEKAFEYKDIKIIRYESPIFYANVEDFNRSILKLSGVDPNEMITLIEKEKEESMKRIERLNAKKLPSLMNRIWNKQANVTSSNSSHKTYNVNNEMLTDASQVEVIDEEELEKKKLKLKIESILSKVPLKYLIIDMGCVNNVDSMGIENLIYLNKIYKEINVEIHLAAIKSSVDRRLRNFSFEENFNYSRIYPTIHDAVFYLTSSTNKQAELNDVIIT